MFSSVFNSGCMLKKRFGYSGMTIAVVLAIALYVRSVYFCNTQTVYKYYNIRSGVNEGLTLGGCQGFLLNGKPLTITSGTIHYFRVHPCYWRDRLRKLRAMGAIAVKTDIPWNLHEPYKNIYDFGNENLEMSVFLDIVNFVQIAKEEDLLVIVGIGPYINALMDFGGLPSYLIGDGVKIRTSDPRFLARVELFFSKLLPLLAPQQVHRGGPIIMFQLENSYGSISPADADTQYLAHLHRMTRQNGITVLLTTCDSVAASLARGALSQLEDNDMNVLQTTNSETDPLAQIETLKTLQPNKPAFIHFRTGLVDYLDWPTRNIWLTHEYEAALQEVIHTSASINLQMFCGGTNFGFHNGATGGDTPDSYHPHTTSFDFDALLTEAGDYTTKYGVTLELFRGMHPSLYHPPPPVSPSPPRRLSLTLTPAQELVWSDIVRQLPGQLHGENNFVAMEDLQDVGDRKQDYQYVRYSLDIRVVKRKCRLRVMGRIRDVAMILVDGWRVGPRLPTGTQHFGFWDSENNLLELDALPGVYRLELLVENCGRISYSENLDWLAEKKGLGPENRIVLQYANPVSKLNITGVPLLSHWINSLTGWRNKVRYEIKGAPSLIRTTFYLTSDLIADTFLDIGDWGKGVVFVNGFNIGRYFCGSPHQTLYVPAPLLKVGENTIVIFEHYYNAYFIKLIPGPRFLQ
ncbi:beta-galactosidase-1-like protein 2 isoform X2 [Homalodisca vitripennis]|uniref:beta-galactosidase-1-like protein 2 isoform X2 n=1 Tax=Homalodisca vitripennis TaxID=197043 RepID=UPI001EEB5BBF|nr:beta-galactosidase-1-like protein 2 isoform X2 [Homalodisca vitripennis]